MKQSKTASPSYLPLFVNHASGYDYFLALMHDPHDFPPIDWDVKFLFENEAPSLAFIEFVLPAIHV